MHLQTPLCSDIVLFIDKLSCDEKSNNRTALWFRSGRRFASGVHPGMAPGWGPGKLIPDWVILPLDFPPIHRSELLFVVPYPIFPGKSEAKSPPTTKPLGSLRHTSPSTTLRCGEPAQTDQTKSNMLQIKLTALYFKKINK